MTPVASRVSTMVGSLGLLRLAVLLAVLAIGVLLVNAWVSFWSTRSYMDRDTALTRLGGEIALLDEVLTMSARMAVATGDAAWSRRYAVHEMELDSVIERTLAIAPAALAEQVRMTQRANERLVEAEQRAIALAQRGELDAARGLVSGDEYEGWKRQYGVGLQEMNALLESQIDRNLRSAERRAAASTVAAAAAIAFCFGVFAFEAARSRREQILRYELAVALRRGTLERMAVGLAHELGQPLAAIGHFADAGQALAAGGAMTAASADEVFSAIGVQATRAGEIIQRAREFAAASPSRPERLDLNGVLRDAEVLIAPHARNVRVEIEFLPAAAPQYITGDRVQLQQLVVNLALNAVEACAQRGGGRVGVAVEAGPRTARLLVDDDGPGIPEAVAARAFDPFFTTKPGGLGLGLTICRDIAEAHGGTITLEPTPRGARFAVELPRTEP